jgi:hypothetical protein
MYRSRQKSSTTGHFFNPKKWEQKINFIHKYSLTNANTINLAKNHALSTIVSNSLEPTHSKC